jgi:hypothetical protein
VALGAAPLEASRRELIKVIRNFDFKDNTRAPAPSLTTWLISLKLEELDEPLKLLGVVKL